MEIIFDPEQISYRDLLEFFFQVHDPTTLFYLTDAQKQTAEDTIADVDASGLWPAKVVTEVTAAGPFWEAEPSTRTTWRSTPTGTPATTCARAGSCRAEQEHGWLPLRLCRDEAAVLVADPPTFDLARYGRLATAAAL
jgi:peptide methionine sulfoxide reductase MsrA